ncbi:MAG: RNA polymerase sigma-70 factor [Bacteroidales bacterium]|nr:RNA polymerase sigma-70 factor [Bacteroidales bacterium]
MSTEKNIAAEKVFEQTFKEYFTPLTLYARKFIFDIEVAKDIVHTIFHNLWEKQDEVDFSKPLKSYLFTSVHNRCLNHIRDNKKFSQAQQPDIESETSTYSLSHVNDLNLALKNALNALPERCREVFELSRFQELKYNEISDRLNVSVKTVEAQMTKALKILRLELKEFLPLILLIFIP